MNKIFLSMVVPQFMLHCKWCSNNGYYLKQLYNVKLLNIYDSLHISKLFYIKIVLI